MRPQCDWPHTVAAYHDTLQRELSLLEVEVEDPDREWPQLSGVGVAIETTSGRREAYTDAWGVAAFPNVPIAEVPHATIEVKTSA